MLREPRALITESVATLPGLDGRKMSKSYGNTIALMADRDAVKDAIRRIVTDSTPPDQPKDPDACTLVALLRVFGSDSTVREVETRYRAGTIGYGETKALLADVIEQHLAPLRDRYERLRTGPAVLHERLLEGERHAARRADRVLARAMTAMGL